jgi:hypothetical protein
MEGEEAEKPGANTARRGSGLAGSVVGAIGWFASSLGVIGALLYACGYLISAAQLHLLGLGRLMTYGHDYYVQEGGSFLADISSTIAIMAEPFSVILIFLAMLGLGVAMLWRKASLRHGQWIESIQRLRTRVAGMWPRAAYAGLLYLLLFRYGDPVEFGRPLTLSNVLFADPTAAATPALVTMHKLLLTGDRGGLGGMFEGRLLTYIVVGLLFLGSHYLTSGWQWRRLAMAPFVLMFTLYSLLLPMLYGVLKLQVEFPIVMIWPGEDAKSAEGQRGFLLNLGEHEAVLYIAPERKVMWRRQDHIDRLDVLGMAPILKEISARKDTP